MIKPILNYNNEEDKKILSTPSCEVVNIKSIEVQKTIQDLKDTLNAIKGGKGLSAIQIGVPIKICICS
jgi:peptide deformylase